MFSAPKANNLLYLAGDANFSLVGYAGSTETVDFPFELELPWVFEHISTGTC